MKVLKLVFVCVLLLGFCSVVNAGSRNACEVLEPKAINASFALDPSYPGLTNAYLQVCVPDCAVIIELKESACNPIEHSFKLSEKNCILLNALYDSQECGGGQTNPG